jgi:hypothetical protein
MGLGSFAIGFDEGGKQVAYLLGRYLIKVVNDFDFVNRQADKVPNIGFDRLEVCQQIIIELSGQFIIARAAYDFRAGSSHAMATH